jgi:hypothetical protein
MGLVMEILLLLEKLKVWKKLMENNIKLLLDHLIVLLLEILAKFSTYLVEVLLSEVKVPVFQKYYSLEKSLSYPYPPDSK